MSEEVGHDDAVVPDEPEQTVEDVEGWSPFDELADEYNPGTILKVEAVDGMMTQFVPEAQTQSDIPVLSPETLICMGIFDTFVVRNRFGEVLREYPAKEVTLKPNGTWWVNLEDDACEVEPIRPPCTHYVRQASQLENNPAHKAFYRLCAARRTTEGAFMSVGNRGMYACDMRTPRDGVSQKILDDFDTQKIQQGKQRVFLPIKR
jgi:hypothetical protein